MENKLKRTGILDIILAACTFALVVGFLVAAFSGALSKEAETWQEGIGYVFFIIVILPLGGFFSVLARVRNKVYKSLENGRISAKTAGRGRGDEMRRSAALCVRHLSAVRVRRSFRCGGVRFVRVFSVSARVRVLNA